MGAKSIRALGEGNHVLYDIKHLFTNEVDERL